MSGQPVETARRPWAKVVARFALALLLILISGSMHNAGLVGLIPALVTVLSLIVLVWAVLGLRRPKERRP